MALFKRLPWELRLTLLAIVTLFGLLSCQSRPALPQSAQNSPVQVEPLPVNLPVVAVVNAPTPPHVLHLPPSSTPTQTQPAAQPQVIDRVINTPAAGAPLAAIGLPTPTLLPTETASKLPNESAASVLLLPSPTPTVNVAELLEQPINEVPVQPIGAEDSPPADTATPTETPIPTETALPTETATPSPLLFASDLANDGVVRSVKVPILMYHYLSVPPANADIYRKDLSVAPELFNAHLDRLQADGYTTITFYELVAHLTQGAPLPEKPVILTFDDGYRDNYENAFPALKAHGMRATFFVVIDFINAGRPEYVTWDMLREMHNASMSIEAHGLDHSSLKKRNRDDLIYQALRSYETLQNELGQRARFVSYPAGQYDATTMEAFRAAGYWAGITTVQGATHTTDHLFELKRVRIRGTTSSDELAQLLVTDW